MTSTKSVVTLGFGPAQPAQLYGFLATSQVLSSQWRSYILFVGIVTRTQLVGNITMNGAVEVIFLLMYIVYLFFFFAISLILWLYTDSM